jgi:hypothetical protein
LSSFDFVCVHERSDNISKITGIHGTVAPTPVLVLGVSPLTTQNDAVSHVEPLAHVPSVLHEHASSPGAHDAMRHTLSAHVIDASVHVLPAAHLQPATPSLPQPLLASKHTWCGEQLRPSAHACPAVQPQPSARDRAQA